ncbi:ATP synthase F1 subunit epsilon [Leptospira sp. 201903074]|uniref:ATP synthase F1 subunit epsilon n=1 Tax=Leptospira abararensis TaxID=2810036 RepID=UPI0019669831|nr:ATP synthase F1 subunit epsilon [Leptospira abararensis]MBM9548855.1 ATP synthase F1 subunit epsilon [Leptospira abararensis]
MSKELTLTVISPDKILYQGKAESVILPGSVGYFGILPGHATLVSQLDFGLIKLHTSGKEFRIAIDGGFCEVRNDQIRVLTEGGDSEDDLSHDHAVELLEEAEALPSSKDKEILLKKAKVRILLHER